MKILVAEDDVRLQGQLVDMLKTAGYVVEASADGVDVHYLGVSQDFDAVVLDLGLPSMDGLTILKAWRASGRSMPVLVLTARGNWHEKVAGIDAGADDYVTKPFHASELLARVRAVIRRSVGQASSILKCGAITLDTLNATVVYANQPVTLTSHEYRLLEYLMYRPGQLISRSVLIAHIYAQDFERDSNTIDVFIGRLRKKLAPTVIQTVRGLGYRLSDNNAST